MEVNQMNNHGRNGIWTPEMWQRIEQAVHDEHKLTQIAAKFLSIYPVQPDTKTVSADTVKVTSTSQGSALLRINEREVVPLLEISLEVALTKQQVEDPGMMAAMALAREGASHLARAEDALIFRGRDALKDEIFKSGIVQLRDATRNDNTVEFSEDIVGLLTDLPDNQVIPVEPTETNATDTALNRYGENTFSAAAKGFSRLQRAQYGRQALVLPTNFFADTFAALSTLIMPENRIRGLVHEHYYGSSALLNEFGVEGTALPTGVLVAIDGDTADLVVGQDATIEYTTMDSSGRHQFRLFERFVLRRKRKEAVAALQFLPEKLNQPAAG